MTQMTPAMMRAAAEDKLRPLGQRRIRLLTQLEEIDRDLRPLVTAARAVEVPIRRITELTAVAPNTVRAWSRTG